MVHAHRLARSRRLFICSGWGLVFLLLTPCGGPSPGQARDVAASWRCARGLAQGKPGIPGQPLLKTAHPVFAVLATLQGLARDPFAAGAAPEPPTPGQAGGRPSAARRVGRSRHVPGAVRPYLIGFPYSWPCGHTATCSPLLARLHLPTSFVFPYHIHRPSDESGSIAGVVVRLHRRTQRLQTTNTMGELFAGARAVVASPSRARRLIISVAYRDRWARRRPLMWPRHHRRRRPAQFGRGGECRRDHRAARSPGSPHQISNAHHVGHSARR